MNQYGVPPASVPAAAESPSPASATPSRLAGADLLRAVAVVGVVVIHASHWPLQDDSLDHPVWQDVDTLARFCVPAFLVLAFLLPAYRLAGTPDRAWLLRRMRRSVLPLAVWAPLYLLSGWFVTGEVQRTVAGTELWLGNGAGHLYFLLLIPQLYLLYAVWRPRGTAWWAAAAAFAVQELLCIWRLYGDVANPVAGWVFLHHGFELFPFWVGWWAVGIALGRALRGGVVPPRWWSAMAAAATVLGAVAVLVVGARGSDRPDFGDGTGAFLLPLLPVLVLGIVGLCLLEGEGLLARHARLARGVDAISRHSLGIYIVHPVLLYLPGRLLQHALWLHVPGSVLPFLALVATTLLLAYGVTRLLLATPMAVTLGEARQPLRRRS